MNCDRQMALLFLLRHGCCRQLVPKHLARPLRSREPLPSICPWRTTTRDGVSVFQGVTGCPARSMVRVKLTHGVEGSFEETAQAFPLGLVGSGGRHQSPDLAFLCGTGWLFATLGVLSLGWKELERRIAVPEKVSEEVLNEEGGSPKSEAWEPTARKA
ncbi:hypothetical protein BDP81DRAFT_211430 [Colletotrichum phormii]|uniref:Uncharacterized protein n=1 Tax=Colletotrichum phormii TaxID=359342 RepID=A0AAI9ZV72_9PEZI|nr:uncharacterized protein BDP81DRAFT_211430 [Colletotrichum phormii]KAK1637593.1 hypothetical protein BDP81DRAFT_211430 [Colletotrichum phormii]